MDWKQILTELVNFVKEAAPAVWEIYRREVYVSAAIRSIFSICVFSFSYWMRHTTKNSDNDDTRGFGGFFAFVFMFCALAVFLDAIGCILNPDYQVIQMMLLTIGK